MKLGFTMPYRLCTTRHYHHGRGRYLRSESEDALLTGFQGGFVD